MPLTAIHKRAGPLTADKAAPARRVFRLASPLAEARDLAHQDAFRAYYAAGLGRFRIAVTTDPHVEVAHPPPADIEEILPVPAAKRTAEQERRLLHHFLTTAPELAKERAEIDRLRKQMPAYPTALVMAERPPENPRPTFLHNRGEYLQPKERVEPDVFGILPSLPKDAPRNRLGLANWLLSPGNPLVGRVTINRQWAAFFGRGIVRTTQDFGYQGEPPSHPELLDWLAVELVRQGWSMKQMHRLIVTSSTYQQTSHGARELWRDIPITNCLRGGRVSAWRPSKSAMRCCGSADFSRRRWAGRACFRRSRPVSPRKAHTANCNGRSAMARIVIVAGCIRSASGRTPFAMFATFDAPSGEVCVARRDVSNTPLQALTLLNDPAFTEAAQAPGRTMAARKGTVAERVDYLFRRCLARPPSPDETAALVKFFQTQKRRFESKELDAARIAGEGSGDVNERAAWTVLARALFNLDEMIVKG